MGLNWVEDIVAHWYRLQDYMVLQNEDLLMPKTADRSIRGHSDIDVLAIKGDELVHVECQSWWGPGPGADEKKQFDRLVARFQCTPTFIFRKYPFLYRKGLHMRNVFVAGGKPENSTGNGPWDRLESFCRKRRVELKTVDEAIEGLSSELRKSFPSSYVVGKQEGVAGLLSHLIHNKYF